VNPDWGEGSSDRTAATVVMAQTRVGRARRQATEAAAAAPYQAHQYPPSIPAGA
jgi:hypothetical protein